MQKRLPNIFKTTNVTKLANGILKRFYRVLQQSYHQLQDALDISLMTLLKRNLWTSACVAKPTPSVLYS